MGSQIILPDQRAGQKETVTLTPDLGGESISLAEWVGDGLTITGANASTTQASAFLQGDTAGKYYPVCWLTTSTGRKVPFVFKLTIKNLRDE